jgi:hypothetical protein
LIKMLGQTSLKKNVGLSSRQGSVILYLIRRYSDSYSVISEVVQKGSVMLIYTAVSVSIPTTLHHPK